MSTKSTLKIALEKAQQKHSDDGKHLWPKCCTCKTRRPPAQLNTQGNCLDREWCVKQAGVASR